MTNERLKICRVCQVGLTSQNSYYPVNSNLLCKTHYISSKKAKKYRTSVKGKAAVNAASMRAYKKHKVKWLARIKARYAVKKGILVKPKWCEVCNLVKPLQGHHEDYSKPLEVIWLCSGCHADADRELESRSLTS